MLSFSFGRRRRRVSILQTGKVVTAAQASPVQPPRKVLPVVIRRPVQPARVIVLHTAQLHGAFQGARPQIVVIRIPPVRQAPRPVIVHTRALPNVVPPIHAWPARPLVTQDYSRQGRWRPVLCRTNSGRLPSPAMPAPAQVGRWRAGPAPIRPKIYATRPTSPSLTPLPKTLAVRLPIIPWRIRPVLNLRTHPQSPARPAPRVIVPVQAAIIRPRPALPWRIYQVVTKSGSSCLIQPTDPIIIPMPRQPVRPRPPILIRSTSRGPQRTTLTVPLVVKFPRQPVRPTRIIQIGGGVGHTLTLPMRPLIVRRPPGLRIWPSAVGPAARYPLSSPALHGPMPRPMIFTRPRLFDSRAQASYKPTIDSTPFPGSGGPLPPDLVAACIAWLRLQPALVAAFGDSAATPSFGSDIAQRGTTIPWLLFNEPEEDESYESADATGLQSSLADGQLGCEIFGSGKLQVRQLAEQVAAVLNDAPLTFADGVLVYLRRTSRKYPTYRDGGPQNNVVLYKRYFEFDYKIERWKPSF